MSMVTTYVPELFAKKWSENICAFMKTKKNSMVYKGNNDVI